MKFYFLIIVVFPLVLKGQNFPETKSEPNTIFKFDKKITDNYLWLENMKSDETNIWIKQQNDFTDSHLREISKKSNILSKINTYTSYSKSKLPEKSGFFYYSLYFTDKDKQSSLYFRKDLNGDAFELFNPNKTYNNTIATIRTFSPSKNSKLIACEVSLDGGDRNEIRFADIQKIKNLEDVVTNVKFSKTMWNKDLGVFYKRNINKNTFAKDSTYQLFYHKIGTKEVADQLIFDASSTKNYFTYITNNNKLYITENDKIKRTRNFYSANLDDNDFKLNKFNDIDDWNNKILNIDNNKVFFSNNESNWGDVRTFELTNRSNETILIPQLYNNLLVQSYVFENYIFCKYKSIGKYFIIAYNDNGEFIKKFSLPDGIDFDIKFFDNSTNDLFISVFSSTLSPKNFKLNLTNGDIKKYFNDYLQPQENLFETDNFITKSISFKNRNGNEVPITIIYKKGMALDGSNPTLLEAYGGYGIISELNYDPALLCFLEKGGVFAFAEIRGGGEKGINWHKDGMGLNKQNCFNDFIDAAEYLIKQNYTSPTKLAISGASHGGLVVGVAMTQRPELFRVAVPKVAVFDMLNYTKYTVGKYSISEFGNPENKIDFDNLLSFSPYHNLKKDINYPTTLIITSENDDRVVPMHSYKFIAELQHSSAQKNPIYLKVQNDSGHNGKNANYNDFVNEKADFYNFILFHLNKKSD